MQNLLSPRQDDYPQTPLRRINVLHHRLREVIDIPQRFGFALKGRGAIVGEEDILGRHYYTSTLKCCSTKASLFKVSRDVIGSMQSFPAVWLELIEGVAVKEQSMIGSHISDHKPQ